jgi:hypothetical protein
MFDSDLQAAEAKVVVGDIETTKADYRIVV